MYALGTTVQMSTTRTAFGKVLQKTVLDAGYGQQKVSGDLGKNLLRYRAENAETETGYRTLYRVEIGEHFAEREYQLIMNGLVASSPLRVSGSNSRLELNDERFIRTGMNSEHSYVVAQAEKEPEIKEFHLSATAVPVFDLYRPESPDVLQASGAAPNSIKTTENMFENRQSNFEDLFNGFEGITSKVLVFPNDSLRLGDGNKQEILAMAKTFDPESEVFSVIGCSTGKTSLADGNRYLAVGRAARVKEELMLNGIAESNIFDEGCWGDEYWDEAVPRRGVVLSRKRRAAG